MLFQRKKSFFYFCLYQIVTGKQDVQKFFEISVCLLVVIPFIKYTHSNYTDNSVGLLCFAQVLTDLVSFSVKSL